MEKNTKNIYFRFDDDRKEVFMRDKTDTYNDTSAYNTLKRGYKAFKEAILSGYDKETGDNSTFWQWIRVADDKYKLRMHTWCAMD